MMMGTQEMKEKQQTGSCCRNPGDRVTVAEITEVAAEVMRSGQNRVCLELTCEQ